MEENSNITHMSGAYESEDKTTYKRDNCCCFTYQQNLTVRWPCGERRDLTYREGPVTRHRLVGTLLNALASPNHMKNNRDSRLPWWKRVAI